MLHVDDLYAPGLPPSASDQVPPGYVHDGRLFNFVALDLVEGSAAALDRELEGLSQDGFAFLRTDMRPTTISDLNRVRSVPVALAAVLALLACATLAHALVVSVRVRSRELAVLRTLGFDRSGLATTVRWQAISTACVAVVAGLPAGLLVGRTTWGAFARGLHIPASATTPVPLIIGVGLGMVLVATLIALVPSRRAAAVRPAQLLRAE